MWSSIPLCSGIKIIDRKVNGTTTRYTPATPGIKNHTRELILRFHLYLGIKIHTQVVENAVYFNGGGIKKHTYGLVMSGKTAKFG